AGRCGTGQRNHQWHRPVEEVEDGEGGRGSGTARDMRSRSGSGSVRSERRRARPEARYCGSAFGEDDEEGRCGASSSWNRPVSQMSSNSSLPAAYSMTNSRGPDLAC
ncbi:hypothetical protein BRADI_4g18660v3, partial [Brachypodium distachyon]